MEHSRFKIDWILVDQLAIGPAPQADRHVDRLREAGIRCVLSLCSTEEAAPPATLDAEFLTIRYVLPDHRAGRLPTLFELETALEYLAKLKQEGAVFVHCVAAMERSPLVCLGWLVREHKLSPQNALDYMMQQHPGTNPLPGQLALLQELKSKRSDRK